MSILGLGAAAAACSGSADPAVLPAPASPTATETPRATDFASPSPAEEQFPACDSRWVAAAPTRQVTLPSFQLGSPRQANVVTHTSNEAQGSVPGGSRDHDGFSPVGPFTGDGLLMRSNTKPGESRPYFSWMPGAEPSPLWSSPEDRQDIGAEGLGAAVVSVRKGFVAPLAEWQLILRDEGGNSACELSRSDMEAYSRDMLEFGIPGLDPRPVLDGKWLTWDERFVRDDGVRAKRIVTFNFETRELTPVAEISDIAESDVWSASVSGDFVSWLHQPPSDAPTEQVVLNLVTNEESRWSLPERPRSSLLLSGGSVLAIAFEDEHLAIDLADGSSVKIMDGEAWMFGSGRYASWSVAPGHVGFYDAVEKTIHLIDTRGKQTVDAFVMGNFFVWQEFSTTPIEGRPGETRRDSKYFALRLG